MVYIAADTKFKLADKRDSDLIKNWNDTVNDDDLVILFGQIAAEGAGKDDLKQIFSLLKGKKKVIDVESSSEEAKLWVDITGKKCFRLSAAIPGEIKGESTVVFIYLDKPKNLIQNYGASARSITGQKEIFEDNIISLSIDDWGMQPIPYMDVPRMIDDIFLFESMEESNNEG